MLARSLTSTSPRLSLLHNAGDDRRKGEACLFLHGIGGNATNWVAQLEALSGIMRAFAWDARGYGMSEDDDDPLTLGSFCSDILHVLDHIGVQSVHLVGLSMGGAIALEFYALHPDRVASLTICSASLGLAELPPEAVAQFLKSRQAPLLAGKEPADIAKTVADSLLSADASDGARRALLSSLSALRKQPYLKTMEAMAYHKPSLNPADIAVPVQLVAAEQDRLVTVEDMQALASRIPGALFGIVEGAGHVSNIEQPERFNMLLLPFLQKAMSPIPPRRLMLSEGSGEEEK